MDTKGGEQGVGGGGGMNWNMGLTYVHYYV